MEIQKWLQSNKDYSKGIVLFKIYSKNKVLLRNLSRNKNLSKLTYELTKIAEKQLREKKVKKAKPKRRVVLPPEPNKAIVNKAVIEHRGKRLMQDYPTQYMKYINWL